MFLCVLGVRARKGERERGGLFMSLRESAGSEQVRACECARVCVTERGCESEKSHVHLEMVLYPSCASFPSVQIVLKDPNSYSGGLSFCLPLNSPITEGPVLQRNKICLRRQEILFFIYNDLTANLL